MLLFEAVVRDLRFATRRLRRAPAFTVVATLSLALGFALATAALSVFNAYLIRSLPYPAADRLYHVRYAPPGPWEPRGMSGFDWRAVENVVEYPIASAAETFYLTDGGVPLALRALRVTQGFVEGLGVQVVAGRRFGSQDFGSGSEAIALIGYALWRERFGGDPAVVGQLLRVDPDSGTGQTEAFRIAGVLSPDFFYGRDRTGLDLLVPHAPALRAYMVRLRHDVSRALAEQRLTEAVRRTTTGPLPDDWPGVTLESAHDRWIGELRPVLFGVTAAVALLLVIVCANVAVLVLLRSVERRHEVAVRLALGAGWQGLARMLLAETFLITAVSAAAGVAVTAAVLRTLAPLIEVQLGRPAPSAAGIAVDTTVLLLVASAGLLVMASLSLTPLTSWGRGLAHALQQDARTTTEGRRTRRLRSGLIAFEVAGSLVLLVGCGLMLRSFGQIVATDLGFDTEDLIRSRIMLRARPDSSRETYRVIHERFVRRAGAALGSRIVFSSWPPFTPAPIRAVESEADAVLASAGIIAVSDGYFSTFGIPLREGREFTFEEAAAASAVAIVSETLARRLGTGTALGRRIREIEQTPAGSAPGPWRTVIGVASDVRQTYDDPERNDLYTPRMPDGRFGMFYVRTRRPAPMLLEDLQGAAAAIDAGAVINVPRAASDDDRTRAGTQFLTALSAAFAGAAAFLAMLGIYGITAYAVQRRRREIAIRVALGATPRTVVRLFVWDGALLLGTGAAAGLLAAAVLAPAARSYVVGVETLDLGTSLVACGLLLAAGFATLLGAGRRVADTDVMGALGGR